MRLPALRGLLATVKHWDKCCAEMAELLEDVRSVPFSPSTLSLLDVMLCARSLTTDFHHKRCSYGECKDCGWSARIADVDIQDEIQLGDDDEAKVVAVNFKAYEKVQVPDGRAGSDSGEAKATPKTRPALLKQAVAPFVFLPLFRAALEQYQKHR